MPKSSTLRKMVDRALAEKGTNLGDYIASHREAGEPLEEIWIHLRDDTQVPLSLRTLYYWLEALEGAAS